MREVGSSRGRLLSLYTHTRMTDESDTLRSRVLTLQLAALLPFSFPNLISSGSSGPLRSSPLSRTQDHSDKLERALCCPGRSLFQLAQPETRLLETRVLEPRAKSPKL